MKNCKLCGEESNLDNFFKRKGNKDGYDVYCKSCRRTIYQKWYVSDKAQLKVKARSKEYYARPGVKERTREAGLVRRFGVDLATYNKMLSSQEGVCAICKKEENCSRHKHLSIDHDHTTGKIRGLLCNNCNKALGQFMDNQEFLKSAVEYLKKYNF